MAFYSLMYAKLQGFTAEVSGSRSMCVFKARFSLCKCGNNRAVFNSTDYFLLIICEANKVLPCRMYESS